MKGMLIKVIGFGSIIFTLGALALSFFATPSNGMLLFSQIFLILTFVLAAFSFVLINQLEPVLGYLDAKLGNGMLLIVQQVNDNLLFLNPKKEAMSMVTEQYGTYLANPDATRTLGGIKTYQVYEEHEVPPPLDAVKLGERLLSLGIKSKTEFNDAIKKFGNEKYRTVWKDLDLKVITAFSNYQSPHYGEVVSALHDKKVAKKALKGYSDNTGKYVVYFIMIVLVAAIAYYIISSGAGRSVASSVGQTAGNVVGQVGTVKLP